MFGAGLVRAPIQKPKSVRWQQVLCALVVRTKKYTDFFSYRRNLSIDSGRPYKGYMITYLKRSQLANLQSLYVELLNQHPYFFTLLIKADAGKPDLSAVAKTVLLCPPAK